MVEERGSHGDVILPRGHSREQAASGNRTAVQFFQSKALRFFSAVEIADEQGMAQEG